MAKRSIRIREDEPKQQKKQKIKSQPKATKPKRQLIQPPTPQDDAPAPEQLNSNNPFAPLSTEQVSGYNLQSNPTDGLSRRRGGKRSGTVQPLQQDSIEGLEYENLGANSDDSPKKKKRYTTTVERQKIQRDAVTGKRTKRFRSSTLEVFIEDFLNKMTKGNLDRQQTIFELGYNRIFADKHTKQIFQIYEFPISGIDVGYMDKIRTSLKNKFPISQQHLVDVIFSAQAIDNPQNLNSRRLRNLEGQLEKQKAMLLEDRDIMLNPMIGETQFMQYEAENDPLLRGSIMSKKANRSEIYNIEQQIKIVERKQKTFDIVESYQRNGGHCVNYYLFVELIVKDPALLKDASDRLEDILTGLKFLYRNITDINNYQKHFGVASLESLDKKSQFDALPLLTTSNVVGCATDFQPGIIRSKSCEIWLGNQIGNNYRFDISVTDSGSAENYLVIAKSGSGKSVLMAFAMLTAMNNPYMNIIIKDYKGDEWSKFASIFKDKADVIAMNADNSVFVNTYKIPDHELFGFGSPETSYQLSFSISVKILTALVDTTPELRKTVQDICTDIVNKVYLMKGINYDAPSTYILSQNINFRDDTWLALIELFRSSDTIARYNEEYLQIVRRSLEPYLAPNAAKRIFFEREIDLKKVLFNNRVLVFDYGAETIGGSQTQTDNEIKTRILQESFCESLFSAINKKKDEFTIIITEELQKQLDDDLLLSELNNSFTVGRSFNKINFGITNTIGPILSSENKNIMAIRENLTGYIVGKVDPAVIRDLVQYTDIKTIQYSLQDVGKGEGVYRNAFLFYSLTHKVDTVITKMPLTEAMINTVIPSKSRIKQDLDYAY